MKDQLNADINSVMKKHALLKSKQDDTLLELQHRHEALSTVNSKTEDLSHRFKMTQDQ